MLYYKDLLKLKEENTNRFLMRYINLCEKKRSNFFKNYKDDTGIKELGGLMMIEGQLITTYSLLNRPAKEAKEPPSEIWKH